MASETSTPPAPPQVGAGATSGVNVGTASGANTGTASGVFRVIPSPMRQPTGPGSWTSTAGAAAATAVDQVPAPRLRQLIGVCAWAAVLGGLGLIIGVRGLIGLISGDAPAWYEPTIVTTGLIGIGLSVAAFLTVHRDRYPWMLLGGSSVALLIGMIVTSAAF